MKGRRLSGRDACGNGATLVEILVVLGILGLITTTAYMVYVLTVRTERTSMTDSEVYEAARRALAVVAEQARMAGLDSTGTGRFGFRDVTGFTAVAKNDALLFSSDANGDGVLGTGTDERVGFILLNGELRRTTDAATAVLAPVARDITALRIVYRNAANATIPATLPASYTLTAVERAAIRRIEFELTVTKQAGTFGTRTITIRSEVRPRNL